MLDIGQSEDWLTLQVALAPCLTGYGLWQRDFVCDDATVHSGNLYFKWIENYPADDYQEAVRKGSGKSEGLHLSAMRGRTDLSADLTESQFVEQSLSRIDELRHSFIRATEMEVGSWDLGSHQVSRYSAASHGNLCQEHQI